MYFRDQHNHNSQPQLLDVILHTLDVLAFSLHFLGGFLVYWFFLHFCFFSFLGVEVFASKHGKKASENQRKFFCDRLAASACVCTTIHLLDVSLHMGHLYFLGWGWVRFGGVG